MSVLSSISALITRVNTFIKTNYQQLITGAILNSILHDIIDTLNSLIDALKTSKLDKTAIGYDPVTGINLPAGATYKVNGVDIVSIIVNGGGPAGPFDASGDVLPTVGTGTAGAILNGNFWRVTVASTNGITGLLPKSVLDVNDIVVAGKDDATLPADFYSIAGNQEIAQILSRLTTIETKLATVENNATADQTASEIRDALQTLTVDSRLDHTAVKNIVDAPHSDPAHPDLDTIDKALLNANNNKADSATLTAQIAALKDNVPVGGDTLRKLYESLQTINSLLTSDDVSLDTVQEIVTYIKSEQTLINTLSTNKVNVADIVDNLLSTVANRPLSAAQGKVLKDLIDALTTVVAGKQASLGFTPENSANKSTDGTLSSNSDTNYPSEKAVRTYVDNHSGSGSGSGIIFWISLSDGATITARQSLNYNSILYFCKTTHDIGTPKTFDATKFDREGDDKENLSNKRSSYQAVPDNDHYPGEKLVKDSLDVLQAQLNSNQTTFSAIYAYNNFI